MGWPTNTHSVKIQKSLNTSATKIKYPPNPLPRYLINLWRPTSDFTKAKNSPDLQSLNKLRNPKMIDPH